MADDSAKQIQALNRGIEKVQLRERKHELLQQGPPTQTLAWRDAETVRQELCELSIFFIEDMWPQLKLLLRGAGGLLMRPASDRPGFVPVPAGELDAPHIADGGATPEGADPLTRIAIYAEILLRAIGQFTERRKALRAINPAADGTGDTATQIALYIRYCDLLAQLSPPTTPTGHAIVNSLAGLQVTLGLAELIPPLFQRTHGVPISRPTFVAMLRSPELLRLILAVAATRSQASNAILAELMGPRFATWSHSLLPNPSGQRSARLRFLVERFTLHPLAPELLPSLAILPDAMARIRELTAGLETPGRSRQVMCPAFFADFDPGAGKVAVIQDFVTWLLTLVEHYYVPAHARAD